MKEYKLDYGWEISFPDNWTSELDEQGTRLFYPPNDSTTAYAGVMHAEKDGESAPIEAMAGAFLNSLPKNAKEIPMSLSGSGEFPCKAFFSKDSEGIYRIIAGFFAEGELLMLNVYSENEPAVWNALEYFKSAKRR